MKKRQGGSREEPRQAERELWVISSRGTRHRFLRGMITHDLIQRGLDFDRAYAVARAVREALSEREEVTTEEIRKRIAAELEGAFGPDLPAQMASTWMPPELQVHYHGQAQPYSRGVLARSIQAAGLEPDRAYRLANELRNRLRQEGVSTLTSGDLARRVGDLLEQLEGADVSRRYRLVRRIHRLPRPLIIFVGGASGTGKSTLSLEVAPLLRIYRINATDTIRQVMRMVFTPNVLPALHGSSFELVPTPGEGAAGVPGPGRQDPDFAGRLTAGFREQASRVLVGVRAVVERAISENMSILVEGVHLYPPMVPFSDLEGAAYQVLLMLSTQDEESHRSRFLGRARLSGRRAERYLENFGSIRVIHDFLIQQAETHEAALVDTSYGDPPVTRTLQLITDLLERQVPVLEQAEPLPSPTPTLLLVVDGLADRPIRALGGRTPLQAAETPTLDRLALEGSCGLADPVSPGVVPDTAAGSLALFGQSPLAMKRGPVEAMGSGLALRPGDLALRGNFATIDEAGNVIDRRAGRIRERAEELARSLDRMVLPAGLLDEVEVRVKVSTEHRLAIVLRGHGLSSAIHGSDPGEGTAPGPAQVPRAIDPGDERAVYTAGLLALFEEEARRILADHPVNAERQRLGLPAANAVLTRGAGHLHRLIPLEEAGVPLRVACVAGDHTVLGLAHWLGAETVTDPLMTANLDTNLELKFKAASEALSRSDLVILHLKGADIAAHDRRPDLKVDFLEKLDRELGELIERHEGPLRIAVASDHATLAESGQHAADPPPVLIWGEGIEADQVEAFDEQSAAAGSLRRFPLQMLLGRLFKLR